MTHEYTLLVNAVVLPGGDAPPCAALAWAEDTILALGTTEEVDAVSRGDSARFDLRGVFVLPAGAPLEIGASASLDVLDRDPRVAGATPRLLASVRDGRVTAGSLVGPGPA